MILFLIIMTVLAVSVFLFLQLPIFGKAPSGQRLEKIEKSPNYKDGAFVNELPTPMFTEGHSFFGTFYNFFFGKSPDVKPKQKIPSVYTDLKNRPENSDELIWFGHSSYLIRIQGTTFLTDPVFSGNASPISGTTKAFEGADRYTTDDMPPIDYLIITHDHYDHLDYKTIKAIKNKVAHVICGLGVGAHLEYWGFSADKIIEKDWNETITLKEGFVIHTLPARHFSGRTFKRNNTLWLSLLLEANGKKIYLGGDSGYDPHFAKIGQQFGPIDLAILENGQYNEAWHAIHCMPEETMMAARDLRAKRLMPVHNSKFALGLHAWYEPMREVSRLNEKYHLSLVSPLIGEPVDLNDSTRVFKEWWKDIR